MKIMHPRLIRNFLLIFLLSGFSQSSDLFGQSFTINGYVEDNLSGERIPDVEIYLIDTEHGTTTNQYGFFSLTSISQQINLLVSHVAYETQQFELHLLEDTTLTVTLVPREINLDELEVVANTNRLRDNVQMSKHTVEISDIETVPVLLGEPDVQRILQLLPGVQGGREGNSGLYIRGGRPDQNLVLLDGLPLYNPSHLLGFFSMFPAQAMKSVQLYKGGFPARYGGRLSSVVNYTMKEGNLKQFQGQVAAGILSSRVLIEGPIKKDKSSFLLSGRRTLIDLLLWAIDDRDAERDFVFFYDLHFKANYIASSQDRFYLSAYTGRDLLAYRYDSQKEQSNDDTFVPNRVKTDTGWGNHLLAFRWNRVIGRRMFVNVLAGVTSYNYALKRYRIRSQPEMNASPNQAEDIWDSGIIDRVLKVDAQYNAGSRHYLLFGLEGIWHRVQPGRTQRIVQSESDEYQNIQRQFPTDHLHSQTVAVYLEDEINLSRRFQATIGIRTSGYFVDGASYWSIEPRLNANYRISERLTAKVSAVTVQQHIHLLTQGGSQLPNDLWIPTTEFIRPQRGQQIAAGLMWAPPDGRYDLSVEVYWRPMQKLLEYKSDANLRSSPVLNWVNLIDEGSGHASGLELFARKKSGRWTGWLGYTLGQSTRKFTNLNDGNSFPDGFDRRHDLSLVSLYHLTSQIEFSATWVYGSGYPVWLPVGEYRTDESTVVDFGTLNNSRAPSYHRLDVGFHFEKSLSWATRTVSAGMYNVYGRKNPFYIYASSNVNQDYFRPPIQRTLVSLFQWIPFLSYQLEF